MDLNNYKIMLEDYFQNKINKKYSMPILRRLLQQRRRKGKFIIGGGSAKKEYSEEDFLEKPFEVCEQLVKIASRRGYDSSVVPTMISRAQAPNFRITETEPRETELWRFLYLLLTGLHFREFVVNLENVPIEIAETFRHYLRKKEYLILKTERVGMDSKKMLNDINAPNMPLDDCEFVFSFLVLTHFSIFWKEWRKEWKENPQLAKLPKEMQLDALPPVGDDATLILFSLPRQKKKMYIFPRLRSVIKMLYGVYFHSEENIPTVARAIFSLYIPEEKYRDKSRLMLNKFLYYLLNGHVNGELLDKLMVEKTTYEIRKKGRIYGIPAATQLFQTILYPHVELSSTHETQK